jgi:hypothetical protein
MNDNQSRIKVFISYARKDLAFAERLVAALAERGVEAKIDTRDLPKLEDWRKELLGFISQADTIVFIVSQRSVASPMCAWEVEQVGKLSKRLAPIVLERVPDDHIPPDIARINYIYFDAPEDFEARADELAHALQLNLSWLKEHTRIGELARRWDERKRSSWLVLRGQELQDAEQWLATHPRGAPQPSSLHVDFIRGSRRSQVRNRRLAMTATAILAAAGLALASFTEWPAGLLSNWIGRKIQAEWHTHVTFTGPTTVRLLPRFVWRAEGVQVKTNPDNDVAPLIGVSSIVADGDPLSLLWNYALRGKLPLALTFERPVGSGVVDKSGRNNWTRPSAFPRQPPSFIEIENFTIRDGVAGFRDELTGAERTISEINIEPRSAPGADVLDLAFNLAIDAQKFDGIGRLSNFGSASGLQVEMDIRNQRQRIEVAIRISGGGETPNIKGKIRADDMDLGRLFPALDQKGRSVALAFGVRPPDDPLLVAKSLKSFLEALDTGVLSRVADSNPSPANLPNIASAVDDIPFSFELLKWLKIDLEIEATDVRLGSPNLGDFGGGFSLDQGRLSIGGVLDTTSSRLEISAKLDATLDHQPATISAKGRFEPGDMERIGFLVPFTGEWELESSLSGNLLSTRAFLGSLSGRLSLAAKTGSIHGYDVDRWWRYLDRPIQFDSRAATTFHGFVAGISLKEGMVKGGVAIDGPLVIGNGEFTAQLLSNTFEGSANLVYKPLAWPFAGRLCCSLDDLRLQRITGGRAEKVEKLYPDDPQLNALMTRVLGDASKRATLGPSAATMLEEWQRRIDPKGR